MCVTAIAYHGNFTVLILAPSVSGWWIKMHDRQAESLLTSLSFVHRPERTESRNVAMSHIVTVAYTEVTEGTKCNRITTADECYQAALKLGINSKAQSQMTADYPSACYYDNVGPVKDLYFNLEDKQPAMYNPGRDCSSSNPCICKA